MANPIHRLHKWVNHMRHLWWARQRRIDIQTLWPELKRQFDGDIQLARLAFTLHASLNRRWTVLGVEKAGRIIGNLPL